MHHSTPRTLGLGAEHVTTELGIPTQLFSLPLPAPPQPSGRSVRPERRTSSAVPRGGTGFLKTLRKLVIMLIVGQVEGSSGVTVPQSTSQYTVFGPGDQNEVPQIRGVFRN